MESGERPGSGDILGSQRGLHPGHVAGSRKLRVEAHCKRRRVVVTGYRDHHHESAAAFQLGAGVEPRSQSVDHSANEHRDVDQRHPGGVLWIPHPNVGRARRRSKEGYRYGDQPQFLTSWQSGKKLYCSSPC